MSNVERMKTVALNKPVPELSDCDDQLKDMLAQSSSPLRKQETSDSWRQTETVTDDEANRWRSC
jgi:hypothetical protein